jgi:hypothetical protein
VIYTHIAKIHFLEKLRRRTTKPSILTNLTPLLLPTVLTNLFLSVYMFRDVENGGFMLSSKGGFVRSSFLRHLHF